MSFWRKKLCRCELPCWPSKTRGHGIVFAGGPRRGGFNLNAVGPVPSQWCGVCLVKALLASWKIVLQSCEVRVPWATQRFFPKSCVGESTLSYLKVGVVGYGFVERCFLADKLLFFFVFAFGPTWKKVRVPWATRRFFPKVWVGVARLLWMRLMSRCLRLSGLFTPSAAQSLA